MAGIQCTLLIFNYIKGTHSLTYAFIYEGNGSYDKDEEVLAHLVALIDCPVHPWETL